MMIPEPFRYILEIRINWLKLDVLFKHVDFIVDILTQYLCDVIVFFLNLIPKSIRLARLFLLLCL